MSGIYNIADDSPLSTNQLISLIAINNNKKVKILNISQILIKRLAKIGDILTLPLNSETLKKLTENYIVSNQKIKNAIAKPFPVSTEEGLLKTLSCL